MRESLISKLPSGEPLVSVHLRLTHKGAPIYECAGEVNQRGLEATARTKVVRAIIRMEQGNLSNVKSVGEGALEFRIDFGPGYRVYFVRRGEALVILVAGGDKRTQDHDITTAIKLARDL